MKRIFQVTVLSLLATGFTWGLAHLRSQNDLEAETVDIRELAFPPETKVSDDIVIVSLDEATMAALPYRSPIPRDFLATLTEKIAAAGPKLIGYDIFFADPSFPEADHKLAAALKKIPAYAVVPQAKSTLPLFADVLKGVGLADLPFNPFDATVREARLEFSSAPTFAALLYHAATGKDATTLVTEEPFTIRFAGPPSSTGKSDNTFKIYSAALVAKGLIPAAWLNNKIVLIGAGYEDLKDAYLTPYYAKLTNYARMSGVEIHANIVNSLLTQQFYRYLELWKCWFLVFIFAFVMGVTTLTISPWKSAGIYGVVLVSIGALAVFFFQHAAIIVPIVLPATGATLSFGMGTGWRALTEGKQKRWIKGVFSHYVPAQVVDRIVKDPSLLKLGGDERVVTSLFSDIESFTTISEKLNPVTLVKFLNDYLGRMNEILFRHGATLDKYEGDAIIAFFNAPLETSQHELAAARAAIEFQQASRDITIVWRDVIGRDIVTRVGLATGPAVVGNMGSAERFDYTAIGDTINLASRLEGTNKVYKTHILCSEATTKGLTSEIVTRFVDRVQVKGKEESIAVYEVVGFSKEES